MGLNEDLALIMQKVDEAIDSAMQTEVTQRTKEVLAESIQENVYDKYEPEYYERKRGKGGLQDKELMIATYNPKERVLEVSDERCDTEQSRFDRRVADIVEEGLETQPFPRPFHKPAEEKMGSGEFEFALRDGLLRQGFDVK